MSGIGVQQIIVDSEQSIAVPQDVNLTICPVEGIPVLAWWGERTSNTADWKMSVPVADCLADFVSLAKSSPEDVLAFAQRRGVLGVWPQVHSLPGRSEKRYTEPISVYQHSAQQVTSLLSIGSRLYEGNLVQTRLDWDNACPFPLAGDEYDLMVKRGPYDSPRSALRQQYQFLSYLLSQWLRASHIRLEIKAPDYFRPEDDNEELLFTPRLTFGHWDDGDQWDKRMLETPGRSYAAEMGVPSRYQRPSPLFSLLAVQLGQKMVLPSDICFCSNCGKPYQHDLEKGNRPRSDKKNSWCSSECKAKHKQRYDKERYTRRKSQEKTALPDA